MEASLHLHLRKQPIRHGNVAGTGDEHRAISQKRPKRYEMANEFVDGMDVMAVRDARFVRSSVQEKTACRRFLRFVPIVLWATRCPIPGNYRTRDEIQNIRNAIRSFFSKTVLKEAKVLSDKDFEKIEAGSSRSGRSGSEIRRRKSAAG